MEYLKRKSNTVGDENCGLCLSSLGEEGVDKKLNKDGTLSVVKERKKGSNTKHHPLTTYSIVPHPLTVGGGGVWFSAPWTAVNQ